ncbi:hypothetical protein DY000_02058825 [Brassica cretica]|uniref:Phytocyanin domain-containing protein n=1 Tax=Brassica cretica TaxID=69181 RepID=A0ABQ7AXY3_BRACR|nr:hypothetical protein DY000_02058825 [Brassica cretica]
MATTTRMFCFVLVMVLMGCCCSAKIYKVGDSKGWTAKHGTYYDWAKRNEFQVGDSLTFQYDGNVNDVTQVSSRLEYQFCNSLSPKAVYNTGHDVVTLTEPGYHFFITSNHSQCVAGQKLVVLVVHDHPIPPPPPPRKILPFGKDYKVGDSNEWRVPEENDFYSKWSEEKQFHVGDNLLFYYNDQVDDVLEINSDIEFKSCDTTSPVDGLDDFYGSRLVNNFRWTTYREVVHTELNLLFYQYLKPRLVELCRRPENGFTSTPAEDIYIRGRAPALKSISYHTDD